jgi:Mrp family chromosome partitioning ATPase
MLLAGGVGAALALAFLLELFVDRSLKRPGEIESKVGVPLLVSIPVLGINGNGKHRRLNGNASRLVGMGRRSPQPGSEEAADASTLSRENAHPTLVESMPRNGSPVNGQLSCYCEALRDRLITFFEIRNLTHKPKLVAVTSCGTGSGVTTIAAGLAASLSETGDGNVLLVDMNGHDASAHHFFKGRLECCLDDALETGKREPALVQEHLYVVSEGTNGDRLPRVLPKRFTNLVPRMKASDYDYIIFDMPAINQLSVTPRLARFMDFVVMVVESEKADRDVVKRGLSLLAEPSNVGVVLNKRKAYIPRLLRQEL